jgi:hypothetical protein
MKHNFISRVTSIERIGHTYQELVKIQNEWKSHIFLESIYIFAITLKIYLAVFT